MTRVATLTFLFQLLSSMCIAWRLNIAEWFEFESWFLAAFISAGTSIMIALMFSNGPIQKVNRPVSGAFPDEASTAHDAEPGRAASK